MNRLSSSPNVLFSVFVRHAIRDNIGIHLVLLTKLHLPVFYRRLIQALTVVTSLDYIKFWKVLGKLHRDNGPAFVNSITMQWFQHGILHRTDGPAHMEANGSRVWYHNGLIHRDNDQPAQICVINGCVHSYWYQHGNLYRDTIVDGELQPTHTVTRDGDTIQKQWFFKDDQTEGHPSTWINNTYFWDFYDDELRIEDLIRMRGELDKMIAWAEKKKLV